MLVRVGGGGGAAGQAQLREDVAEVGYHGLLADDETLGDLTVGEPLGDVGQDFLLAAGQTAGRPGREVQPRPGSGCVADRVEAIEDRDGTGELQPGTVVVANRSARGCDRLPGAGGLVDRAQFLPTGQRLP